MRFDELPIYKACHEVHQEMEIRGEFPGADGWTSNDEQRVEITKRIMARLIEESDQTLLDCFMTYRKSSRVDGVRKLALIVEVAKAHGSKCFYANRGKGECSNEVQLERLVPGARGGIYSLANCVIACSHHNQMRSDTPIEEFLSKE